MKVTEKDDQSLKTNRLKVNKTLHPKLKLRLTVDNKTHVDRFFQQAMSELNEICGSILEEHLN